MTYSFQAWALRKKRGRKLFGFKDFPYKYAMWSEKENAEWYNKVLLDSQFRVVQATITVFVKEDKELS